MRNLVPVLSDLTCPDRFYAEIGNLCEIESDSTGKSNDTVAGGSNVSCRIQHAGKSEKSSDHFAGSYRKEICERPAACTRNCRRGNDLALHGCGHQAVAKLRRLRNTQRAEKYHSPSPSKYRCQSPRLRK